MNTIWIDQNIKNTFLFIFFFMFAKINQDTITKIIGKANTISQSNKLGKNPVKSIDDIFANLLNNQLPKFK